MKKSVKILLAVLAVVLVAGGVLLGFFLGRGSNGMISQEDALTIALNQAGVNKSDVDDIDIELERRRTGNPRYEVDFEIFGRDYDCFIDAVTGQVLTFFCEGNGVGDIQSLPVGQSSAAATVSPTETPAASEQPAQVPVQTHHPDEHHDAAGIAPATETATPEIITREDALAAALADAGLAETEIYDVDVDLDLRRNSSYYEVDFETQSTEYEYDIDAFTGEILRSRNEPNR